MLTLVATVCSSNFQPNPVTLSTAPSINAPNRVRQWSLLKCCNKCSWQKRRCPQVIFDREGQNIDSFSAIVCLGFTPPNHVYKETWIFPIVK